MLRDSSGLEGDAGGPGASSFNQSCPISVRVFYTVQSFLLALDRNQRKHSNLTFNPLLASRTARNLRKQELEHPSTLETTRDNREKISDHKLHPGP